jgi:Transketolase, N-terminal subunit
MNNGEKVINRCEKVTKEMRKDLLWMALSAGNSGAHLGGGLSMIEIMSVLYLSIMNYDANNPRMDSRDRLILSKGHGVLAMYAAMRQIGLIPYEDLQTFKSNDTYLTGHPTMNLDKGIEFSSGSLGQGLSLGVGTCIALKRKGNNASRVFVIIGDGECDEGSVWEAAMSAAHYRLDNLVVIVDKNGLQYDGDTSEVLELGNLADKWKAFGWETYNIDGHSVKELYNVLTIKANRPIAVIANTVKGKGVSFMENNPAWHNGRLTKELYEKAITELEVV